MVVSVLFWGLAAVAVLFAAHVTRALAPPVASRRRLYVRMRRGWRYAFIAAGSVALLQGVGAVWTMGLPGLPALVFMGALAYVFLHCARFASVIATDAGIFAYPLRGSWAGVDRLEVTPRGVYVRGDLPSHTSGLIPRMLFPLTTADIELMHTLWDRGRNAT